MQTINGIKTSNRNNMISWDYIVQMGIQPDGSIKIIPDIVESTTNLLRSEER